MARKLSGRETSLLVTVVVLGVVYLWYSRSSSRTAAAEAAAAAKAAAAGVGEKPPRVPMDLLTRKIEGYNPQGRDLFKYAQRPPTAAELRAERELRERQRLLVEAEAKARQEAAERERLAAMARQEDLVKNPPKPQPPQILFKYVGYLGPKDDKIAVFLDGEETLVAKRGETIKEQFKVVDIKMESVVMGFTKAEFKDVTRELSLTPIPR